jgi:hypothetical protein
VNSRDLRPDQLRRARQKIARELSYITRLVERMQELSFPSNDALYDAAVAARNALEQLDRAAMVGAVRHGMDKVALDMSASEVRRA